MRNGRARDSKVDKVTGNGWTMRLGRDVEGQQEKSTRGLGFSRINERGEKTALIKKKRKFSSYIRKFRGIGCKVIYD